jgi:tetratricopeptide (TPR) repeat protein
LLTREKKSIHGRVAQAIESQSAGNLDAQVEILAGHYLRSAYQEKALHYLILAGQKAAREYANQQSLRHFSEAAALLSHSQHSPEQAREVWAGIGDVLTFMGDYSGARQKFQIALNTCSRSEDSGNDLPVIRVLSRLNSKIAATYERQGDYAQALQHLEKAHQVLEQTIIPSPYEKASILNAMGWIYFLQGKFGDARKTICTALALVEGSKHFDVLASIHNRLGAVAYQERSYYESEMHVSESLALRERMNDKPGVARLYNNLGLLGLMRGNLRKAEENFVQSALLLERTGDAEGIALSNINLGLVKIDRGDLESAGTYLAKAIQAASEIGHRYYLALAKMYIGRINTEIGDYPAADRCLKESLAIFTEIGAADGRIDTLYYLAENYLACNDFDKASAYASQMEEKLLQLGTEIAGQAVQLGRVRRLSGKLARLQHRFTEAKIHLEESDRIFSQSSEKLELGRTYLELGLLARAQHSPSQAKGFFQQAYLICDQLGAERDLIKAKTELDRLQK